MKILILGGYGTFGGRLAQLLAQDGRLTLLIAGRSEAKARLFCGQLSPGAQKIAIRFERDVDVEGQLRAIQPDVLVDATGPFQSYGGNPYRVVKACIALGIDYMDLADGSDFVKGIAQFDAQATARGIYVLSGASSFPVLTAAVVRSLARGMTRVESICGGIAPSPYAGVGPNVLRAIAAYAGKRVRLVRGGRPGFGYALTESMRFTIRPPGYLPLRNQRFSLVDVPDLQLLPDLWPQLGSIWMGAGPVPEVMQRMLNGLAWLVRLRVLRSLSPLAPLFHFVSNHVRWGEHRGGMFVSVKGTDSDGNGIERSWHLLAEGSDGPLIPSMAVEAIVRRCLAGSVPGNGARSAACDLEVADYESLFRDRTIYTGQREARAQHARAPLYRRVLGDAWERLPVQLRTMHDCDETLNAEGRAIVERGRGVLSNIVGFVLGFPKAGQDIPLKVSFTPTSNGERWTRAFGSGSFSSVQSEGRGRSEGLLMERFGPLLFGLALVLEGEQLSLIVRSWSVLGLPLPLRLAPHGISREYAEDGRFRFDVEIKQAMLGLIVRYRGWLVTTS